MHLALFNQHHHNFDCPSQGRHYSFLRYLAKYHQVTLICSDAWAGLKVTDQYPWVPEGVKIISSEVPYANKMNIRQRLMSYSGFALHAFRQGLKIEKPDVVWGVSTPLSTPWIAAKVAAIRKVPFVCEIQDLWPTFPIEMGAVKQKWMQDLLYREERKLYHQAKHVITSSSDMTAHVINSGEPASKVTTLVNGTDYDLIELNKQADLQQLRGQYGIGNRKVVLYAGTYGRANDIITVLETAKLLQDQTDICFVFMGSGFYGDKINEAAQKQNNIILPEPQARHQVFKWYMLADISLVPFINLPVLATNSPAKFFDSLAVGTPVIVTNPGWTKAFVEKYNCGWYVPSENPEQLSEKILEKLYKPEELKAAGENGAAVAKEQFDREMLSQKLEQILLQVAGQK